MANVSEEVLSWVDRNWFTLGGTILLAVFFAVWSARSDAQRQRSDCRIECKVHGHGDGLLHSERGCVCVPGEAK